MSDPIVTLKALSDETGINWRTIKSILERADLKRQPKGFPHGEAMAAIALNCDPDLTVGHAAAGRGNVALPQVVALAQARARSEHERSRKLKLLNDQIEGKLVDRGLLRRDAENVAVEAQQKLMTLGARCATKLVNESDARVIKTTIEAEVAAVLTEFCDHLRQMGAAA